MLNYCLRQEYLVLFNFGLFVLIIFTTLRQIISKFINSKYEYFNDFEVCIISALVISLWPFSPSGSFFNNWMCIVYFFPIGMLLWQISKKNKQQSMA